MIEKDKTIINLVNRLKTIFDISLVEFVDYWDSDLCAIGLKREDRLIYINTYNYLTETAPMYDYTLEIDNFSETQKLSIIKEVGKAGEAELISELMQFLKLNTL